MQIEGRRDYYFGDWRIQLSYPKLDVVWDRSPYKSPDRTDVDLGLVVDAPAFRFKRLKYRNTDGSSYSYFALGFVFIIGFAVDYLAGVGAARKSIEQNAPKNQKNFLFKLFGTRPR